MLETVRAYAADRLDDYQKEARPPRGLDGHVLARYTWANVTTPTTLSDLSIEADTVGTFIDGLLDDERDDETRWHWPGCSPWSTTREAGWSSPSTGSKAIAGARPGSTMLTRAHLGAHLAACCWAGSTLPTATCAKPAGWWPSTARTTGGATCRWPAEADLAMRRADPEVMARAADHLRSELDEALTDIDRVAVLAALGEVEGERVRPTPPVC